MAPRIVVMGVSGSGKSTVGRALAQALGLRFVEGDALHPPRNVALMAAGTALTDADRCEWLRAVTVELAEARETGVVVSCSALKRSYRDLLRAQAPDLRLIYLHGSPALLAERMLTRSGHYMPPSLLQSQLDTLEPPDDTEAALVADITLAADRLVRDLQRSLTPTDSLAPAMHFTKVTLHTAPDGRACFREDPLPLTEGKPQARLSALMPSGGLQLRISPVGFRSEFHCTDDPQWVFILAGRMEIGLQDGSSRIFEPGQHFYSADTLPPGARFDASVHGHWSRQLGNEPLTTAFVRAVPPEPADRRSRIRNE